MSCGTKLLIETPATRLEIGQPVFVLYICLEELPVTTGVAVLGQDGAVWDLDGVYLEAA